MTAEATTRSPLCHEALLYTGPEMYVEVTTLFARSALAAGDPVLAAVPAGNLELIRRALGARAGAVEFVDMSRIGRNPSRIIPWVLRAFLARHEPRRALIIGEPLWPARAPEEVPLAIQHEALINRVFADREATILCPYDAAGLDPPVLASAARTHPLVSTGEQARPSAAYTDPDLLVSSLNVPLAVATAEPAELAFDLDRLPALRQLVRHHASEAGVTAERIADLQLAVHEVAANALVHGGGPGTLLVWREPGRVVCEVHGLGHIADQVAGRIPPGEEDPHGRGLLVANLMCDLVQTFTHPLGTTTRMHMLAHAG